MPGEFPFHVFQVVFTGSQAYSHHMRLRLAAQMGQSVLNTPSSYWKLCTMIAAVSELQQRASSGSV